MIGRLSGELVSKQPPHILVDVNGVGYEVESPMSTIFELPETGQSVTLLTHLVVREDAQILYAFLTEAERLLFRTLVKVNGVGPKMALGILSAMNPVEFKTCVLQGDTASLTKIPGVGKKTAERLVVEMRDRFEKTVGGVDMASDTMTSGQTDPLQEATQALVALGYKPAEASRMISAVEASGLSSDEVIRQALKGTL